MVVIVPSPCAEYILVFPELLPMCILYGSDRTKSMYILVLSMIVPSPCAEYILVFPELLPMCILYGSDSPHQLG